MTATAEEAPAAPDTAAQERPTDGSCSHWSGARYCRQTEGVRYFLPGHRCPVHTPNALRGMPEPPSGPGIPTYNRPPGAHRPSTSTQAAQAAPRRTA